MAAASNMGEFDHGQEDWMASVECDEVGSTTTTSTSARNVTEYSLIFDAIHSKILVKTLVGIYSTV